MVICFAKKSHDKVRRYGMLAKDQAIILKKKKPPKKQTLHLGRVDFFEVSQSFI